MAVTLKGVARRCVCLLEALALVAVAAGLAVLANAANPNGVSWTPAPPPLAEEAGPAPVELAEAQVLQRHGKVLFLDARYPADYETGHIPGALSIPVGTYAEDVEALLSGAGENKVLVAYCSNVHCPLAHRLAEALDMIGIEGVRVFEGGMQEWTQAGEAVETGPPTATGTAGAPAKDKEAGS